uniref:Uncharacterized protein n=1 Tax=Ditylum brightwellii TaxID=49249 RepID=A0A7S4WD27_9STRA
MKLQELSLTGIAKPGIANLSLSNLELLHLHDNRLQGTVPRLALKGQTKSSFIADCGSPSEFDTPLDCPDCTMCCNSQQECDVRESQTNFGKWASVIFGSAILALFLASTVFCAFGENFPTAGNALHAIGKDSAYSFFLSSSPIAWVLAITVLATQALCFGFFIDEAKLEFGDDRFWRYSFFCPRNNLECRNESDVTSIGIIFFVLLALIFLLVDILNGLKLVWGTSKYGFSKESFQIFVGGCSLFSITCLALYATVVYNVATSRSNVDMIFNTVILFFVPCSIRYCGVQCCYFSIERRHDFQYRNFIFCE